MSYEPDRAFLSIPIRSDMDVILVRRRAKQIAVLTGMDLIDQTRLATAVSEIARNAFDHGGGGKAHFLLESMKAGIEVVISDTGDGIAPQHARITSSTSPGISGARKLVDSLEIESQAGSGTTVTMQKYLPGRTQPFTRQEIARLADSLAELGQQNPLDEIQRQNQELVQTLAELQKKQVEIELLNQELEHRVRERTFELESSNSGLVAARDEAIRANRLKSQFVSNISHEIRTPMTGILGLSELLSHAQLPDEQKEMVTHIYRSAKNMMVLVDDLLNFSKLENGRIEFVESEFNICELVEAVKAQAKSALEAKKLTFSFDIQKEIENTAIYKGDAAKIKQVLTNLLNNAIKFTEVGVINLKVEIESPSEDGQFIRFSMKDQGIGISAANLPRLFIPFVQLDGSTTRKYGGVGLGLAYSKRLIDIMKGVIGCESEEHRGSNFWFVIPLKPSGVDRA